MSDLGLELGKWLFEKRPGLLVFKDEDIADALNAVAAALGGLLSITFARSGEEAYEQSLRVLFTKVDNVARRTVLSAKFQADPKNRKPVS